MAKELNYKCKNSCYDNDCYTRCGTYTICKVFYNLDYRKIDKDRVVLSRKEYDNLRSQIQEAHNKGVRVGFDLTKFKENSIKQARKEMATTFYDKFNENISCFELDKNVSEDYKEGYVQALADICGRLDETAVELGVDLQE